MDDPIRVGPVKVGVLVDHLRLEPEAELHAQVVDPPGQTGDAAGEAVPVGSPVPQAREVVAPGAEPAVVQDEELHAVLVGRLGDGHQLILGEVEVGGFPVVDENGPGFVPPLAPGQTAAVELVESTAHGVHPLVGVDHHRLGGLEGLPGGQLPVEAEGINAQGDPGDIPGVHLRLGQEVAGVDEGEADDLALILVRAGAAEHDKGVVVVGGVAPGGLHGLDALLQTPDLHPAFPGPGPGEVDKLIVAVGKVQAEAHGVGEVEVQIPLIHQPGGAGQRRPVREEGVVQIQGDPQQLVPQVNGEGFGLAAGLAVGGGQTL